MERFESLIQTDQNYSLSKLIESFIGTEWLDWLDEHCFHFIIRIRANQYVEHSARKSQRASSIFSSEQWKSLRKPRRLKGAKVYIGGQKLGIRRLLNPD